MSWLISFARAYSSCDEREASKNYKMKNSTMRFEPPTFHLRSCRAINRAIQSDINELEIALDHANKANAEGQKAIKRYQGTLRDTIQSYEDETRLRQQIMESVGISERKANALSGEVACDINFSYNFESFS